MCLLKSAFENKFSEAVTILCDSGNCCQPYGRWFWDPPLHGGPWLVVYIQNYGLWVTGKITARLDFDLWHCFQAGPLPLLPFGKRSNKDKQKTTWSHSFPTSVIEFTGNTMHWYLTEWIQTKSDSQPLLLLTKGSHRGKKIIESGSQGIFRSFSFPLDSCN